jgi:hypothetical protein
VILLEFRELGKEDVIQASHILEKIDRHKEICEKLNKIYTAKNEDYGDSFSMGFQQYGLIMPAIRLEDKLRRYKN